MCTNGTEFTTQNTSCIPVVIGAGWASDELQWSKIPKQCSSRVVLLCNTKVAVEIFVTEQRSGTHVPSLNRR